MNATPTSAARVIKRYPNRKLYDVATSNYVTLAQIADMIRSGQEVRIVDNDTKQEITELTLAQVVAEELRNGGPRAVPIGVLTLLIRNEGERLLGQLRSSYGGGAERPQVPSVSAVGEEDAQSAWNSLAQRWEAWQTGLDERLRTLYAEFPRLGTMQTELKELESRTHLLESRLEGLEAELKELRQFRAEREEIPGGRS